MKEEDERQGQDTGKTVEDADIDLQPLEVARQRLSEAARMMGGARLQAAAISWADSQQITMIYIARL